MKNTYLLILFALMITLFACSKTPTEKAHSAIQNILKENLENPTSYEPVKFSSLKKLDKPDTSNNNQISYYTINHIYNITNSENDIIKNQIYFFLDEDCNVNYFNPKSINGDYGSLEGNVYWKYNDYVGNKPDAGAVIKIYGLDSVRKDLTMESTADINGFYKIDNIPPGNYFLVIQSENATDCPEFHLKAMSIYSPYIKEVFGFDLDNYKKEIAEINSIDSLASEALFSNDNNLNARRRSLQEYEKLKKKARSLANDLINSFPNEFTNKIKLFTGYSYAYDFDVIRIEEGKTVSKVTDHGITCI